MQSAHQFVRGKAGGVSLLKLTFFKTTAKMFSSLTLARHFRQVLFRAHPFPFGGIHMFGIAASSRAATASAAASAPSR